MTTPAATLYKRSAPAGTSLDEAARKAALKFEELTTEVFEEGTHGGREFTKADVEALVKNYNEWGKDLIKSPLVLGHDEKQPLIQNMGMPSLGEMVSCHTYVKPNGKLGVIGKFSDVPTIAKQAIQKRLYRRISPEIYQNFSNPNIDGGKDKGLSFRRISLLGADIPEVKTLADVVAFGEENVKVFFAESEEETMTAEQIAALRKEIQDQLQAEADKKFNAFSEANKKELDALKAENKQLKDDNASLATARAADLVASKSAKIAAFIESQKGAGKVLPAWEKLGLQKFMESLDDKKVMKFSEEKDAVEVSPMAFFQEFIKGLPAVVELSEITADDLSKIAVVKGQADSGKKNVALDAAIKKEMADSAKGGKVIKYAEAMDRVIAAHPELAQ